MTYNIIDRTASTMPKPSKVTEIVKSQLLQASKPCMNPLFRCFFPHLAHTSASQNFSILTAFGRSCAAKWPISYSKMAVKESIVTNRGGRNRRVG